MDLSFHLLQTAPGQDAEYLAQHFLQIRPHPRTQEKLDKSTQENQRNRILSPKSIPACGYNLLGTQIQSESRHRVCFRQLFKGNSGLGSSFRE